MRHILELKKKNLISSSALDSVRCRYISKNGVLKAVRVALVIIKGIKHSSMYEVQGETVMEFTAETSDASVQESELCDMHLGHVDERSLKVPSERNLLCDYIADKLNICRCCDSNQWRKVQFRLTVKETT